MNKIMLAIFVIIIVVLSFSLSSYDKAVIQTPLYNTPTPMCPAPYFFPYVCECEYCWISQGVVYCTGCATITKTPTPTRRLPTTTVTNTPYPTATWSPPLPTPTPYDPYPAPERPSIRVTKFKVLIRKIFDTWR